jgi:hypothetical protein
MASSYSKGDGQFGFPLFLFVGAHAARVARDNAIRFVDTLQRVRYAFEFTQTILLL